MGKGQASTTSSEISILELNQGELNVCILGTSPLIYNAMSEKAKHELLFPGPRKNAAERASNLKHEPFSEYRNSTYQNRNPKAETLLNFPAACFKKAMASAALDIPGAAKAQIGRLVWAVGDRVDVYGVPQIFCAITRSADMNKTPDVRTRAIVPEWACRITLRFMQPILKGQTVANLLAAAGVTQGVGDWRQQKGSGSYGQFVLCSADDPRFLAVIKDGGRAAQDAALKEPSFYDEETERLLQWFVAERVKREGGGKNGRSVGAPTVEA
jgi:hypothetical protein